MEIQAEWLRRAGRYRPVYLSQRATIFLLELLRSLPTEPQGIDVKGLAQQLLAVLRDFKDSDLQYRELQARVKATAFWNTLESEMEDEKRCAAKAVASTPEKIGRIVEKKLKVSKQKLKKARKRGGKSKV